jgi:hypothetical protein
MLFIPVLLLLISCGPSEPIHTLSWDSNVEPDISEYRVHSIIDEIEALFAIAAHVPGQERQWVEIPDTTACYFIEAVDTSGNVSKPSLTICR